MTPSKVGIVWVCLLGFCGAATNAQADEPDPSTPKAAAHDFWVAIDQGDAEAAKKVCFTKDERLLKWVDGHAAMCAAFRRRYDAAAKRFGEEAAKQYFSAMIPARRIVELIDKCEVYERDGKTYLCAPRTPAQNITRGILMDRRDGKWLVVLSHERMTDALGGSAELFQSRAKDDNEMADAIETGKYASAKDARDAERARQEQRFPSVKVPAPLNFPPGTRLAEARKGFETKLVRKEHENEAVPTPPADLFRVVEYESPAGKLAAYLSIAPKDKAKHPAILWIMGGFSNSIGETPWEKAPPSNDQSASAFRKAGLVMMYPSLRGGNKNPGFKEGFFGEVDDVLAAAAFLAKQEFVDPSRIYLGGHSTGGTLALLAAESSNRFRAVISFGPVRRPSQYGRENLPFDVRDPNELQLRSPTEWLDSVHTPTFAFEGEGGTSNITSLQAMAEDSHNPFLHFHSVPRLSHFSVLAPATGLIAAKLAADTGPEVNLQFSDNEMAQLATVGGK